MVFFLGFFHYFRLLTCCCFLCFCESFQPPMWSILVPTMGSNRGPSWFENTQLDYLVLGSHFDLVLGSLSGPLGDILGRLGASMWPFWRLLNDFPALGAFWGTFGEHLGSIFRHFGSIWDHLGSISGHF